MCGIAGVRKFGGKIPITGEELILLLCALEHRGSHATGIALYGPDGIHVLKAPKPAWEFTKSKEFAEFLTAHLTPDTTTALLHTRWATIGNPEDNRNNHPMWDGETAVVHNGGIGNHQALFHANGLQRSCETDSDIIRAILSQDGFHEKGFRSLNKMWGSAAIAAISTKFPGKLVLGRSGSPLVFGFTDNGDKLYWASEAQAIAHAARPWRQIRGTYVQDTKPLISLGSLPNDTIWLFGENDVEMHHEFKTCTNYVKPNYAGGRQSYHTKTRNWKKELRRATKFAQREAQRKQGLQPAVVKKPEKNADLKGAVMQCTCGKGCCNTHGVPWDQLYCWSCKAMLG
jgi:asparagine synthetase B (glutamine-hydrolysing)